MFSNSVMKTIIFAVILCVILYITYSIQEKSEKKVRWPCSFKTPAELMEEYPEMKHVWDEYTAKVNKHETAYEVARMKLQLAYDNGEIGLEEYLTKDESMSDQSMEDIEHLLRWVDSRCEVITGTKLITE